MNSPKKPGSRNLAFNYLNISVSVPKSVLYLQGEVLSVLRGGDRGRGGRCGCGCGAGSAAGAGGALVEGGELLELIAVEVALVRHLPEPLVQVGDLRAEPKFEIVGESKVLLIQICQKKVHKTASDSLNLQSKFQALQRTNEPSCWRLFRGREVTWR